MALREIGDEGIPVSPVQFPGLLPKALDFGRPVLHGAEGLAGGGIRKGDQSDPGRSRHG